MKKVVILLIMIIGIKVSAFSLTSEAWLYFGPEYGNFIDSYTEQKDKVNSYMGSLGINFGGYRFFNDKNYGIFAHGFFAFPLTGYKEINGVYKNNNYDGPFQTGLIFGIGFRYNFTKEISFKWALGLNMLMSWLDYSVYIPTYGDVSYETFRYDAGFGGDYGVKVNITKSVILNIGSIVTFDFFRYLFMDASNNKSSKGRVENFYMFGIRPYISVGFIINREYEDY